MSTAVLVHELCKKFITPRLQIMGRSSRMSLKASGYAALSHQAIAVVAVDHVSFDVHEAEIFGVLGASDSGKTTLIRLLATVIQPDTGDLHIFGQDAIRQPRKVQGLINRISVEASFFKTLSPLENMLFGARRHGVSGNEMRLKAQDLLVRLGIETADICRPMELLSRTAQQIVTIANTLLARPPLLLLDDPTRRLDFQTISEVRQVLRELRESHGTTILVTAEDKKDLDGLCDRTMVLENGRLKELEAPEVLKEQFLFHGLQSMIQRAPEFSEKSG
jgi:ABC-2 type transport system ATP-binding protein